MDNPYAQFQPVTDICYAMSFEPATTRFSAVNAEARPIRSTCRRQDAARRLVIAQSHS